MTPTRGWCLADSWDTEMRGSWLVPSIDFEAGRNMEGLGKAKLCVDWIHEIETYLVRYRFVIATKTQLNALP